MRIALTRGMKLLPALGFVLSSCYVHRHYDDPPIYVEIEPNDTVDQAPLYAGLHVGSAFSVRGHINDFGFDVFDGVAVRADEAVEIHFDLYSEAYGTDLDVCVFDPDLDRYVVCADGPWDPEHGSVVVLEPGKIVHLVVTSAFGDCGYRLDVHASYPSYPLGSAPPANAPDAVRDAKRARAEAYRGIDAAANVPLKLERRRADVVVFDLESGVVHDAQAVLTRVSRAR